MTSFLDTSDPERPPMNAATRAYVGRIAMAMVAYSAVLLVSVFVLEAHPHAAWRPLVAILPIFPALLVPAAVVRLMRTVDELQRRIQLEALAFAFGAAAVVTFGYGFLQLAGFPQASWLWVWPVMGVLWVVGLVLAVRRYR